MGATVLLSLYFQVAYTQNMAAALTGLTLSVLRNVATLISNSLYPKHGRSSIGLN